MNTFTFLDKHFNADAVTSLCSTFGVTAKLEADAVTEATLPVLPTLGLPIVIEHNKAFHLLAIPEHFVGDQIVDVILIPSQKLDLIKV